MRHGLIVLALLLLALPASNASAATVCVQMPPPAPTGCANNTNYPTLTAGLGAAGGLPGRDEIRVGPVTLNERALHPNPLNNPVDIVGSGQGPGGSAMRSPNTQAALVLSEASSTVSNMRFVVPGDLGSAPAGLDIGRGQAHDVTVVGEPGVAQAVGIYLREQASLSRVTVSLPATGTANRAISATGAGTHTVEDSVLTGDGMLNITGPGSNVVARRLSTAGPCDTCVDVQSGNSLHISDSLLLLDGADSFGVGAQNSPVTARNLTVVGSGGNTPIGFRALGSAGGSSSVTVLDSIISNVPIPLQRWDLSGPASVSVDYSNFKAGLVQTSGPGAVTVGGHNIDVDPLFANAAAGDFRLRSGSPVADRGSPAPPATAFDLALGPRLTDANGDGNAVLDMGAYEYQGAPFTLPPVGDNTGPKMVIVGKSLRMNAKGRVTLGLACPTTEPVACSGDVKLATAKRVRVAARRRLVTLGRKPFKAIPRGTRGKVTVKLSRKNRRLVKRLRKVRVKVTVTATDEAGNRGSASRKLTLKPARRA